MAEDVDAELRALQDEYNWLLSEEVHNVLQELQAVLSEGCKRFPVQINTEDDSVAKAQKFLLASPNGSSSVKCMITLLADHICEADLTVRVNKQQTMIVNSKISPEMPWRVQQIQDAGNHLTHALAKVEEYDSDYTFTSGQEVLKVLDSITESLQRGRTCLALPKKRTLEELVRNPVLKAFKPLLPSNTIVSFYVQAQKLILAVYNLYVNNQQKIDIHSRQQVECSVPWLNDVLVLFTLALQQCQQLHDKLTVFIQYEAESKFQKQPTHLDLRSRSPASRSCSPTPESYSNDVITTDLLCDPPPGHQKTYNDSPLLQPTAIHPKKNPDLELLLGPTKDVRNNVAKPLIDL